jgi:uncharacterized protein YfdQ (DUF2303 family)
MDDNSNIVDAIVAATVPPKIEALDDDHKLLLLPQNFKFERIDLSQYREFPARKSTKHELRDVDSFIAYVREQGTPKTCRIYAETDYVENRISFTAVLNDHDVAVPNWRDFRAIYQPIPSIEWKTWCAKDGKPQSQADFAIFLDDNIKDIASVTGSPTGAQILEMALNFEAKQEAVYRSAIRLQSGTVSFEFTDKEDDSTIKRMDMFSRFTLGIAPYFNGEGYELPARLRYKLSSGKIAFWFDLIRPDLVLQQATLKLVEKIKTETGFPLWFGKA